MASLITPLRFSRIWESIPDIIGGLVRTLCHSPGLICVALLCGCDSSPSTALVPEDVQSSQQAGSDAVAGESRDVGQVFAGQPAEHAFRFVNETTDSLALAPERDVRKTCGCTSAAVNSTKLAPGEATLIRMNVSTGAKHGPFSEKVVISWHAADRVVAREYTLSGTVAQAFRFKPAEVRFRAIDLRNRTKATVEIQSDLELDWKTLTIAPPGEALRASIEKPGANGNPVISLRVEGELLGTLVRTVRFSARLKANPGTSLTGELPVMIDDSGLLRLASKSTLAAFDETSSAYKGHIILRCDKSESTAVTNAISLTLAPGQESSSERPASPLHSLKFASRVIAQSLIRVDFSIPAAALTPRTPGRSKILVKSGDFEDQVNLILP